MNLTLQNVFEMLPDVDELSRYLLGRGNKLMSAHNKLPYHNKGHALDVTVRTIRLLRAMEAPEFLIPRMAVGAMFHDIRRTKEFKGFGINTTRVSWSPNDEMESVTTLVQELTLATHGLHMSPEKILRNWSFVFNSIMMTAVEVGKKGNVSQMLFHRFRGVGEDGLLPIEYALPWADLNSAAMASAEDDRRAVVQSIYALLREVHAGLVDEVQGQWGTPLDCKMERKIRGVVGRFLQWEIDFLNHRQLSLSRELGKWAKVLWKEINEENIHGVRKLLLDDMARMKKMGLWDALRHMGFGPKD